MILRSELAVIKPPFLAISLDMDDAAAMIDGSSTQYGTIKCLLLMMKLGDIPKGNDNVPTQFSIIISAIFNGNVPAVLDSLLTDFCLSWMDFLKYPDHEDKYFLA